MNMYVGLLVFLIAVIANIPFLWQVMSLGERKILVSWLYIKLPRSITKTRKFQNWHYQTLYQYSEFNFWSRCFVTRHNWKRIEIGLHCKDCNAFVPNYDLSGNHNLFPEIEGNLLEVIE